MILILDSWILLYSDPALLSAGVLVLDCLFPRVFCLVYASAEAS